MKHSLVIIMTLFLAACQQVPSTDFIEVHRGQVRYGNHVWRCAVGRNGVTPASNKREGDGCTPEGLYELRELHFRPDKMSRPATAIPARAMTPTDGWCDDPAHPSYNRAVTIPFPASHEVMWREDDLYDLVAVIGYNDHPPIPGKGSAIFLHVATPDYRGTAGCVAMSKSDLLDLLSMVPAGVKIRIH